MKRIVLGAAAVLFAIVPVLASADCGPDHATMASVSSDKKPALAQAGKTPVTTKVATKQTKSSTAKKTTASTSNQEAATVVARTN